MNEEKIISNDVPQKFADWLLSMGCPAESIPPMDKLAQMCRGQYYMIWRSMMEHVEPKDFIRHKRLQVFADDVRKCEMAKPHDSSVLVPTELSAWRTCKGLTSQLTHHEAKFADVQRQITEDSDKNTSKLARRKLSRQAVEDAQRRVWLLQTAAEELKTKKDHLLQAKSIAGSLRHVDGDSNVQNKLDKCISLLRKQVISPKSNSTLLTSSANTTSTSTTGNAGDTHDHCEEHLSALAHSSANEVCSLIHERRASLLQTFCNEDSPNINTRYADGAKKLNLLVKKACENDSVQFKVTKR